MHIGQAHCMHPLSTISCRTNMNPIKDILVAKIIKYFCIQSVSELNPNILCLYFVFVVHLKCTTVESKYTVLVFCICCASKVRHS